ncbi:MAG: 4-(cytidine 5'-diphospho)-2-C-methyl-D-erythritol kinase [Clostridiales bacterium]|nr:4-(cytidine 5'-diphospho)-2-C-methyl-D-erythritol kinase [Clostridiales bacterium]
MEIIQRIPAKINLTLDVKGKIGDYHEIESLVVSIDLFDTVVLKKRKDNEVTIKEEGIKTGCTKEENNAYKAANLFMDTYNTSGVDIILKKKIPLAGGLGGSSADIAAVLIGMKKLFRVDADLKKLSSKLGSDVVYMLNGGFSLMTETGSNSLKLKLGFPLYFIILTNSKGISSKDCYENFDKLNKETISTSRDAFSYLLARDFDGFKKVAKNDLYLPAVDILPEIKKDMEVLETEADFVSMTGAGSSLFMLFSDKKKRDIAYRNLKKKGYKGRLIKAKSIE